MSDYDLWRVWWMSALYGAGAVRRMEIVDNARRGRGAWGL